MGFYLDREDYVRALATQDQAIRHNQPVVTIPEDDADLRRSFFRINNDDELLEASQVWIHFPCLVMISLTGNLIDKKGSIRQANHNAWLILSKAIELDDDNGKANGISRAYDETFETVKRLKKQLLEDFDEGNIPDIRELDENTFKWEQVGPVGDQLYGWSFTFTDETRA